MPWKEYKPRSLIKSDKVEIIIILGAVIIGGLVILGFWLVT